MRARLLHAAIALLAIAPGAHELLDAAAHAALVDAEHELAAVHQEEHEDSERGCAGPVHACVCHAPSIVIAAPLVAIRLPAPASAPEPPPERFERGRPGHVPSIFRPPIG